MSILGVDLSNHNHALGPINFPALAASGVRFVVLKASEGVGFKDPYFDDDRRAAHAVGLIVLAYHFGRANDPGAEAAWFLQCVGPLAVGEGVVLDDEVSGIGPAWVQAWCGAVHQATTVWALVYMNQATRDSADWSGVGANDGLWLAKYDGTTAMPPAGSFGAVAMKQYTDAGTAAGIAGGVDLDVFYGTTDQLAAYGLHSSGGWLMALTDAEQADLYAKVQQVHDMLQGGMTPPENNFHWLFQQIAPQVWTNDAGTSQVHPIDRLIGIDGKTGDLETKVDALTAAVAALQSALAAMPAAACQGNPKAVLSALGQAASTAATSAT